MTDDPPVPAAFTDGCPPGWPGSTRVMQHVDDLARCLGGEPTSFTGHLGMGPL